MQDDVAPNELFIPPANQSLTLTLTMERERQERILLEAIKQGTSELELYSFLNESKDIYDFNRRVKRVLVMCDDLQDWSHMFIEPTGFVHESAGTVPKGNRNTYLEEGLYHFDMMVIHAKHSDEAILQSTINNYVRSAPEQFVNPTIERNRLIARLMDEYGYPEYYNIPFDSTFDNRRGIFAVATRGGDPNKVRAAIENNKIPIHQLARAIDYVGCKKFPTHFPDCNQQFVVNNGPLLLLQTIASAGCEVKDAAKLLNISKSTAYAHSQAANNAFKVNNITGAILAALKANLITLQEDWTPPKRKIKRRRTKITDT